MVSENSFYKAENYFLDVDNVTIIFFPLLFRFLLELRSCILLSRFSRGFLDPGDMGSGVEIDLNFTLRRFIGFFDLISFIFSFVKYMEQSDIQQD